MTATSITAAIVAALVAITLIVFAGGGERQSTTPDQGTATNAAACQTTGASNCAQAARGLVQDLNDRTPAEPTVPVTP